LVNQIKGKDSSFDIVGDGAKGDNQIPWQAPDDSLQHIYVREGTRRQ
jgi:hypothetical protein